MEAVRTGVFPKGPWEFKTKPLPPFRPLSLPWARLIPHPSAFRTLSLHIPISKAGDKHDTGKVQWQFLPWGEVEDVARVTDFGAKKYAPDNWKHVPNAKDRYFSAAMRHLVAWKSGEKSDKETGLSHLAHAVCCLLFIMWFDKQPKPAKEK